MTIVAIDGPSGSGKSSVSKGVASRLGFEYLDTGAMYRAVTWWALDNGLSTEEIAGRLGECAIINFVLVIIDRILIFFCKCFTHLDNFLYPNFERFSTPCQKVPGLTVANVKIIPLTWSNLKTDTIISNSFLKIP